MDSEKIDRVIELGKFLKKLQRDLKTIQLQTQTGHLSESGLAAAGRNLPSINGQITAALGEMRNLLVPDYHRLVASTRALTTFVSQLKQAGIEDDTAMGGADTVDFICQEYPTLKAALS